MVLEMEPGLSNDNGIDRCDISDIYSEDHDSKDKTHRHMNSEYFHPEDKIYLKRFGKRRFRNKLKNKKTIIFLNVQCGL